MTISHNSNGNGASANGAARYQPDKIRVAIIGVNGRGANNLDGVRNHANIVALCDVDTNRAGRAPP